jgi:uncharacterized membrane protein YbaN (DUF454 family)/spermidine synthase
MGRELKRRLLVAAGFVFVGIGVVGVVVPLLPTTPFLLLAAYCFLRGSPRWHAWLLGNRLVGGYLQDYLTHRAVPQRTKIVAIAVLWSSIGVSIIVIRVWWVGLGLVAIAAAVSAHILRLRTMKRDLASGGGSVERRGATIRVEPQVLERVEGRSGELVLRRSGDDLEIIVNGAFLISTSNDASSRAMIAAALPHVVRDGLQVAIGGLGLGYALDEALACERTACVTVAEYEPAVERWFRELGAERAERAAIAERAGRASLLIADVREVLAARPAGFDLVALDTDNGPEWLVREENASLYSVDGIALVRRALRAGGAGVFWSPGRFPEFQERVASVFGRVLVVPAWDTVDGRRHEYTMYVGLVSRDT